MELVGVQVTRAQITALLALAVVTFGAWLFFAGVSVGTEYLGPFSLTVGVLVVSVALFNQHFWHWPIVRTLLADRPYLAGAWKVSIESNFIDQATGQAKTIEAYYLIRQTYLHISIRTITKETTSKTQCAQLVKSEDGEWALQGTYLDTPDISLRERSTIHYGAFSLVLAGDPISGFRGHYWTDRGTKGTVRSVAYARSTTFGDFDTASQLFK